MNHFKKIIVAGVVSLFVSNLSFAQEQMASKPEFPEVSKSYNKQVQRYDMRQIQELDLGLNKDQIRHILGNPHFSEGIIATRTWNYLLDIHQESEKSYQRCQLKINFDQHDLAEKFSWKGDGCQKL